MASLICVLMKGSGACEVKSEVKSEANVCVTEGVQAEHSL